jgi:undecaprenyl-diphosphatase
LTFFEALLLGIIQGATEFLPISSSGHLVLSEAILGVSEGGLLVEVTLHAGTLMAVLVYFRSRLHWLLSRSFQSSDDGRESRRYLFWLLLATVPAGAVGLLFEDSIASAFESPRMALTGLLLTGAILLSTKWCTERDRPAAGLSGLWMGFAQAVAILPGISRSGSTIAVGMWSGVNRRDAAEFSFLLSIPAIGGASLLHLVDLMKGGTGDGTTIALGLITGFVASFISGYAAIAGLLEILKRHGLVTFVWYCWEAGLLGLILI